MKFSIINKLLFILVIGAYYLVIAAPIVYAQTVDPAIWQNNANGLLTTSNSINKTAGLGFYVSLPNAQSWPLLQTQGGVINGYNNLVSYNADGDPFGIDLGQVKIPGVSTVNTTQSADWAYNTINVNSSQLNVTVSRLSLAALINTTGNSLRLFSGNVNGATTNGTIVTNRAASPSYPKYVAFHTTAGYQVRPLSTSSLVLSGIDQNWLLVWYGNNSHFVDTKVPNLFSSESGIGYLNQGMFLLQNQGYQADAPILLTFQNNPVSIVQSLEGGIDLIFSLAAGNLSVMPLFGRDHPQALLTEGWGSSGILPNSGIYNVISKLNFWTTRTCNFPGRVEESYGYNLASDTTTITDTITYTNVCSGAPTFAPISPMVAVARNTLGLTFSGTVVDSNTSTEFGPLQGIENTDTYSWSISGLKKYTDSSRVITNHDAVPADLLQDLETQVDRVIQAGHLAPWLFTDKWPVNVTPGEIYWLNPADTLLALSELVPVLPDPWKTNLITYLRSERMNAAYNPETVYNLPLKVGTFRQSYAVTDSGHIDHFINSRPDQLLDHVPLYSYFGLSRYYDVTGDNLSPSLMTNATTALGNDLSNVDWATFSKFQEPRVSHQWPGYAGQRRKEDVVEANRLFAGLVGLIRLSRTAGDTNTESIARGLLVRIAVTRLAMTQFPSYLYSIGMVALPSSANWQVAQTSGKTGTFNITNYNWVGQSDDLRQVGVLDQFETKLIDLNPDTFQLDSYYTAYRDMVPELFRFLGDYAKPELEIYRKKIQATDSRWYTSFRITLFGQEHGLDHPVNAFQLFMEEALVGGATPQDLTRYLDIPWLSVGDFFYMQKLAETIKAYQGWKWEDEGGGIGVLGDVNNDAQVNVLDVQACVNHILGIQDLGSRADVNNDGSVDVLDVQNIVNIILGV